MKHRKEQKKGNRPSLLLILRRNYLVITSTNDSGVTFGDKLNISNTTASNSQDAEVAAEGDNVAVTWWERTQTSNEPVMRISGDNGSTFGPITMLGVNGTIIREAGAAE